MHRQNYREAVQLYDRAIALAPESPVARDLRGYALYLAGRNDEAAAAFEKAVELSPSYPWGDFNLALVYWKLGRKDDAVHQVEKVVDIDKNFRVTIRNDPQFRRFESSPQFRALMQASHADPAKTVQNP